MPSQHCDCVVEHPCKHEVEDAAQVPEGQSTGAELGQPLFEAGTGVRGAGVVTGIGEQVDVASFQRHRGPHSDARLTRLQL